MTHVQIQPGASSPAHRPPSHLKVQQVPHLLQGGQDLGSVLAGAGVKVPELGLGTEAHVRTRAPSQKAQAQPPGALPHPTCCSRPMRGPNSAKLPPYRRAL